MSLLTYVPSNIWHVTPTLTLKWQKSEARKLIGCSAFGAKNLSSRYGSPKVSVKMKHSKVT
jgi:hypothetical protein